MKKVLKNVYYCDYCKKKGLGAFAIIKHEKYCTANPDRECRLCLLTQGSTDKDLVKELIEKYKKSFKITTHEYEDDFGGGTTSTFEWVDIKITPEDILDKVDGCPACALTIVRLSGLSGPEVPREEFKFEYQKFITDFWNERHSQEFERERMQMSRGDY